MRLRGKAFIVNKNCCHASCRQQLLPSLYDLSARMAENGFIIRDLQCGYVNGLWTFGSFRHFELYLRAFFKGLVAFHI